MVLVVGMLGLGEAGGLIAADLRAAGVTVRGYDPLPQTGPDVGSEAAAAAGADVVLSLTTAAHAREAAHAAAGALRPGQVYADLNTSGAALKRELAALVAPTGATFADVALMATVPGHGVRTPVLASGPGARELAVALGPLGMPVEVVGPVPGDAAQRKLLRSVLWKGVAAAVTEALAAARAAGQEAWMREQIVTLFESADGALARRMEQGSIQHAERRMHEMRDVAALLHELDVPPRVAEAAAAWLEELNRG